MINVRVHFDGEDKLLDLMQYIKNAPFVAVEGEAMDLAEKAVELMKDTISSNRHNPARPGKRLENALGEPEEVLNEPGRHLIIGIGNITKMVAEASYFELINDGGTYITRATHIVPTNYFSDPEPSFVTFKEGSSHNIAGINYFDKGENFIRNNLDKMIEGIIEDYVSGMKK